MKRRITVICFCSFFCSQFMFNAGAATSIREHNDDIAVLRKWWMRPGAIPSPDTLGRIEQWSLSHPEDAETTFYLSELIRRHVAVSKNISSAELLQHAATENFELAKAVLGYREIVGVNAKKNLKDGEQLLDAAIRANCAAANYFYGVLLLDGQGGHNRDTSKAAEALQKAANGGFPMAWGLLAVADAELGRGVQALAAAKQGVANDDPQSEAILSHWYSEGFFTAVNDVEAFRLLSAAVNGAPNMPEYKRKLADMYAAGCGIGINREKAFQNYHDASDAGDKRARFSLAMCFLYGSGTREDDNRAIELLQQLSKDGYGDAQFWLGRIYIEGLLAPP